MLSNRILIYSDDSAVINSVVRIARKSHIHASAVDRLDNLIKAINRRRCLAVFLDYRTLNNSEEITEKVKRLCRETFVVLIAPVRKVEEAVSVVDGQIFEVLKSPVENESIKNTIERLNHIKFIVRNLTRNVLEIEGNPGRSALLSEKDGRPDTEYIEHMSMEKLIELKLKKVLHKLNLDNLKGFYNIVMEEVEKPLLKVVMESVHWNQIKASRLLGINRNTLSKKLRQYHIKK